MICPINPDVDLPAFRTLVYSNLISLKDDLDVKDISPSISPMSPASRASPPQKILSPTPQGGKSPPAKIESLDSSSPPQLLPEAALISIEHAFDKPAQLGKVFMTPNDQKKQEEKKEDEHMEEDCCIFFFCDMPLLKKSITRAD